MFLLQVAFVTMFAFRTHMLRALETQLTKIFPIDMPDACTAHLLHLSTGEHDEHIVRWAGLGLSFLSLAQKTCRQRQGRNPEHAEATRLSRVAMRKAKKC